MCAAPVNKRREMRSRARVGRVERVQSRNQADGTGLVCPAEMLTTWDLAAWGRRSDRRFELASLPGSQLDRR